MVCIPKFILEEIDKIPNMEDLWLKDFELILELFKGH